MDAGYHYYLIGTAIPYSSGRALPRKERIHFKNSSGYHYYLLDI